VYTVLTGSFIFPGPVQLRKWFRNRFKLSGVQSGRGRWHRSSSESSHPDPARPNYGAEAMKLFSSSPTVQHNKLERFSPHKYFLALLNYLLVRLGANPQSWALLGATLGWTPALLTNMRSDTNRIKTFWRIFTQYFL